MPLKSTRQIMDETNRVGVQFLLTDIAAGQTFLDVSNTTQSKETRERNRRLALTAYQTVERLLPRVTPSEEECEALQRGLAGLRNRLVSLGIPIVKEDSGTSCS